MMRSPALVAQDTVAAIKKLAKTTGPIVVGPWIGEVGFEVLYWIPFLAWAIERGRLDPERLVVVSRGGAQPWYAHLTPQYRDLLEDCSVADIRANKGRVAPLKQRTVTTFDHAVIRRLSKILGPVSVLHPSLMYQLCLAYWHGQVDVGWLDTYRRPQRFQSVPMGPLTLPAEFVAMKFYQSAALPGTALHRQFVLDAVLTVAETTDVVLLESGVALDDHVDYPVITHPRVHRVPTTPATNLGVQTAILQQASAFVGTYGGFSYVAPLLGVPSVSFYSHERAFRADHLALAERSLAQTVGAGRFQTFSVREGLGPIRDLRQAYQPRYPLTFTFRKESHPHREGRIHAVVQEATV